MTTVRPLHPDDIDDVVTRVQRRLALDASLQPLINPVIDRDLFVESLRQSTNATWVALEGRRVVGHLYGALLDDATYGNAAWTGPDGASFDDVEVLSDLYAAAGTTWIDAGAVEHYVWTLDDAASTSPWYELGFARMHTRGVRSLPLVQRHAPPAGYALRRGGVEDLDAAVMLDRVIDDAQRLGPSFSLFVDVSKREDLHEALVDPEVHHYLVEHLDGPVAQCITFALPTRRGSFERTLHLSAVSVLPEHRGRGVATALVDHAMADASAAGFAYVETNWRVTNRAAQRYWLGYGFRATYVRLHRTIGSR